MADEDVARWSISRLKKTLDAAQVSYADVNEKGELVARVRQVLAAGPGSGGGGGPRGGAAAGAASASPPPRRPSAERRGSAAASGDVGRILACDPADLYGILDVDKSCDGAAIKKSYRRLALRLHPDKCDLAGSADAFKRVSAAFATLSDTKQRRHYDYFGGGGTGESSSEAGSGGRRASASQAYAGFGDSDAEELFRAFFGGDDDDGDDAGEAVAPYDFSPGAIVQRAKNAANVARRLSKTFVANPWTLITALSGLVSLCNVASSLVERFGAKLVVLGPAAGLALARAPAEHRRTVILTALAILCSGLL